MILNRKITYLNSTVLWRKIKLCLSELL